MNKSLLTLILLFTSSFLFAQNKYIISGTILEERSKTPLPFVNVFLEGTTIGTQTDINGKFTLSKIPIGKYKFVASMVGYLSYIQDISRLSSNAKIDVILKEDVKYLSEVKVATGRDKVWEKQVKKFEREFLGDDFNRKLVKITNREIIEFTENEEILSAQANLPLIIENKLLGYRYHFILENFEYGNNRLAYKGLGRFELLDTTDSKQNQKYKKNRENAYKGSQKHFLRALLNGNLEEAGYSTNYINIEGTKSTNTLALGRNVLESNGLIQYPFSPKISLFATDIEKQYLLILDCPLRIFYNNGYNTQLSNLKQIGNIILSAEGELINPYSLQTFGAMGKNRIAKTLPYDYELEAAHINEIKKIDISNLPIVLQEPLKFAREKVDITGIENYYLAGENIDIEAFVKDLTTQAATEISKVLYLDIIDNKTGTLKNHYIFKIENGLVNFKIPIGKNFETGNYHIRAYTNWMRNFSEKGFFTKNVTIFSRNYKKELEEIVKKPDSDILIIHFPNNNLVENIRTKIALKAINKFSSSVNLEFKIIANSKDTLLISNTDSSGITLLDIEPKPNENLQILAGNKLYDLPKAAKKGSIMTVDNLSNSERIKVFIQNKTPLNEADTMLIAILKEGQVLQWKSFLNDRQAYLFSFLKDNLEGQYTLLLIDKTGQTIVEREIYINNTFDLTELEKIDRKLFCEAPKEQLKVDKLLPFREEKGLMINGNIVSQNVIASKKPIKLTMTLNSVDNEKVKLPSQSFVTSTTDNFLFENLQFHGKKQAIFGLQNYGVVLDTTLYIPSIYKSNLPINWHEIQSLETLAELEARFKELTEIEQKSKFEERTTIQTDSIKTDENAIDGISPSLVIPKKLIGSNLDEFIYSNLLEPNIQKHQRIFVFIEEQLVTNTDFKKLNKIVKMADLDKIIIFEEVIPPQYAKADLAIVLKLKSSINSSQKGETQSTYLVRGFDN